MLALASEFDRLTGEQQAQVTWVIVDDGTWTEEQIQDWIDNHFGTGEHIFHPDDWTKG